MARDVREDHGILWRDSVQLLPVRESLVGPKGVVPSAAGDPFPFFVMRNRFSYALLHLLRRLHAAQFDRKCVRARTSQVHVRVIEPGHYKMLVEMNCLRALLAATAVKEHVSHLPDAHDFSVSDGHGFGPGFRRIVRVNPAMRVENSVLRRLLCVDLCVK